jgi:hypothetical protein
MFPRTLWFGDVNAMPACHRRGEISRRFRRLVDFNFLLIAKNSTVKFLAVAFPNENTMNFSVQPT